MKPKEAGYTLVELILAMLIFAVVMTLISLSFSRIAGSASSLVKSAETDIGGLIGLELMRCDLELAGFGLPWKVSVPFLEAEDEDLLLVDNCPGGCPGARAFLYNDHDDFAAEPLAPTAYRVGSNVGFNGSDYLVLKGTALGNSEASRSWCYLNYSSGATLIKPTLSDPELRLGKKIRTIVLKTGVAGGAPTRELVLGSGTFTLTFNAPLSPEFLPRDKSDNYLVYGVAPEGSSSVLAFPFNRADYYISRPDDISPTCNKATGILYKTVTNHTSPRSYSYNPILDCVADMQIVLYMDTDHNGVADYHPYPEDHVFTPQELREELKEIRVYILAQQGKKDPEYRYPADTVWVGDTDLEPSLGRVWSESAMRSTFGEQWRNYRWKLYTIVVQPKNL